MVRVSPVVLPVPFVPVVVPVPVPVDGWVPVVPPPPPLVLPVVPVDVPVVPPVVPPDVVPVELDEPPVDHRVRRVVVRAVVHAHGPALPGKRPGDSRTDPA